MQDCDNLDTGKPFCVCMKEPCVCMNVMYLELIPNCDLYSLVVLLLLVTLPLMLPCRPLLLFQQPLVLPVLPLPFLFLYLHLQLLLSVIPTAQPLVPVAVLHLLFLAVLSLLKQPAPLPPPPSSQLLHLV